MGKLTISMAIFNSYVSHYQRVYPIKSHWTTIFLWFSYGFPVEVILSIQLFISTNPTWNLSIDKSTCINLFEQQKQRFFRSTTATFFAKNYEIWANYNNSLTWVLRPFGDDFPISKLWFPGFARSELVIIYPVLFFPQKNMRCFSSSTPPHIAPNPPPKTTHLRLAVLRPSELSLWDGRLTQPLVFLYLPLVD